MRRMPAKIRLRVWLKTFRVDEREQALRDNATHTSALIRKIIKQVFPVRLPPEQKVSIIVSKLVDIVVRRLNKLQGTVSASK